MIWELHQLVLVIHIMIAITWVGGVLFIGWGLYPAIRKWSFSEQRRFLSTVMNWVHFPLTLAGIIVVITGILLGTVLGPINHISDVWQSRFGLIWVGALLVALFTLGWGVFIGNRMAIKLLSQFDTWENADKGDRIPLYWKLAKVAAFESIEVLGFVVLLFLMVSF
jgi:copper resistance protein D